eukprot:4285136-Amphidinium_carterae.1
MSDLVPPDRRVSNAAAKYYIWHRPVADPWELESFAMSVRVCVCLTHQVSCQLASGYTSREVFGFVVLVEALGVYPVGLFYAAIASLILIN